MVNVQCSMVNQLYTLIASRLGLRSLLFIAGNIALPHLFHLVPGGGIAFLPIYWFTLIGAMACGLTVGLTAALLSPLLGWLIFGAPAADMLPDMLLKGTLLSLCASFISRRLGRNIPAAALSVAAAWLLAALAEWPLTGAVYAFQDFVGGWPGLLLMSIVAPWAARKA